jgi:hypothetical protein
VSAGLDDRVELAKQVPRVLDVLDHLDAADGVVRATYGSCNSGIEVEHVELDLVMWRPFRGIHVECSHVVAVVGKPMRKRTCSRPGIEHG